MKILKEDLGFGLAAAAYLLFYSITYLMHRYTRPKKDIGGKQLPGDNVWDAIDIMWKDKSFMKDFAKVLSDEGDFDKIQKQIQSADFPPSGAQYRQLWLQVNEPNFKQPSITKRIIKRVMATQSYKRLSKRFKFTKEDEANFAKLLYVTISSAYFTEDAKKFIFQTMKKGLLTFNPSVVPGDIYSTGSG